MEESRYELAIREVRAAADILPRDFSASVPYAEKNGHTDIVSEYDKRIEGFLADKILKAFPSDGIIGEEMEHPNRGEWIWYMDPIDGTTSFVNQRKNYAISLACYHNGTPAFGIVYDVAGERLYHARAGGGAFCNSIPLSFEKRTDIGEMILYTPIVQETLIDPHPHRECIRHLARDVRAVRSIGSVALELCALAIGEADIFVASRSCPWDHNAARLILEEVGGGLRTWENRPVPLDAPASLVAARSKETLARVFAEYWTI